MTTYHTTFLKTVRAQLQFDRDRGQGRTMKIYPMTDEEGKKEFEESEPYDPRKMLDPGDRLILWEQSGYFEVCYLRG